MVELSRLALTGAVMVGLYAADWHWISDLIAGLALGLFCAKATRALLGWDATRSTVRGCSLRSVLQTSRLKMTPAIEPSFGVSNQAGTMPKYRVSARTSS